MKCKRCHFNLVCKSRGFSILLKEGNEEVLSVYYCPICLEYYLEGCEDVFMENHRIWLYGPFSQQKGQEMIRQMNSCLDPFKEKYCKCKAHQYFLELFYKESMDDYGYSSVIL